MARLDQGEMPSRERCDIVNLCLEEAQRARFLNHSIDISVRVAELVDDRPSLQADSVREILANLLDNARRHARSRVEVVLHGNDDVVEIRVVDDGPGMTDEVAARAFDRFVSLDSKGGSGLGLPIARGLAEADGGALTYDRESGFVLTIPMNPGAGSPSA
jgi:signal transduction histidine kinase